MPGNTQATTPATDPVTPPSTDPVTPPATDPAATPATDPVTPPATDPTDPVAPTAEEAAAAAAAEAAEADKDDEPKLGISDDVLKGMEIPENMREELKDKLKGVNSEDAKVLLEGHKESLTKYHEAQNEIFAASVKKQISQNEEALKKDPEYSVDFEKNKMVAMEAFEKLVPEGERVGVFSNQMIMSQPEMVKMFTRIGKMIGNDAIPTPGTQTKDSVVRNGAGEVVVDYASIMKKK